MLIPLITAAVSLKIGTMLISKGLEITLPEIAKLTGLPEIEDFAVKIDEESIMPNPPRIHNKQRVQSK